MSFVSAVIWDQGLQAVSPISFWDIPFCVFSLGPIRGEIVLRFLMVFVYASILWYVGYNIFKTPTYDVQRRHVPDTLLLAQFPRLGSGACTSTVSWPISTLPRAQRSGAASAAARPNDAQSYSEHSCEPRHSVLASVMHFVSLDISFHRDLRSPETAVEGQYAEIA